MVSGECCARMFVCVCGLYVVCVAFVWCVWCVCVCVCAFVSVRVCVCVYVRVDAWMYESMCVKDTPHSYIAPRD